MQAVQVRCGLGLGGARSMRRKRAFTLAHVAGQVASTCAMRAMLLDLQCAPFVWHKGTSKCSKPSMGDCIAQAAAAPQSAHPCEKRAQGRHPAPPWWPAAAVARWA